MAPTGESATAAARRRPCCVAGCDRPLKSRGYCANHWKRWRRYGNPLGGHVPHSQLRSYLTDVVLTFVDDACLDWPFARDKKGYARIGRDLVHQISCEEEHGPRPTALHEAAHKCGRGEQGCVARKHVRWATAKNNAADKLIHGTHNRGERHNLAKLTEPEARQILALKGRALQKEIALMFGVCRQTVSDIHRRKRWGWLE